MEKKNPQIKLLDAGVSVQKIFRGRVPLLFSWGADVFEKELKDLPH